MEVKKCKENVSTMKDVKTVLVLVLEQASRHWTRYQKSHTKAVQEAPEESWIIFRDTMARPKTNKK